MIHFTTFVLPATVSGLPHDTPFLVLGANTPGEVFEIPLVTSLHRVGNDVTPFSHASGVLGEVPVSDTWIMAVADYDAEAKVVVLREPMPRDISTEWAEKSVGLTGDDLPPWLPLLLQGELHAGSRDVPVSAGSDPLSIMIVPGAPTTWPEWAHMILPGKDR